VEADAAERVLGVVHCKTALVGEREDAKEAFGHGVRAKRSKSGAVSFEMIEAEAGHASVE
jgi:hypothetical protein